MTTRHFVLNRVVDWVQRSAAAIIGTIGGIVNQLYFFYVQELPKRKIRANGRSYGANRIFSKKSLRSFPTALGESQPLEESEETSDANIHFFVKTSLPLMSQAFPNMAKIYVASSWKNLHYESVVNRLRMAGHEVYDFRNPPQGTSGFHWSDVDADYMNWDVAQYREGLKSPKAEQQFANDIEALTWADTCILVLPCGRSAHTEAGWMAGAGKKVIVYIPEMQEAELMYKLFDLVTDDIGEVLTFLQEPAREFLHMWPEYGEALFWNLKGVGCGDFTRVYLDNDVEIDLTGINGLKEWFCEWDSESLYHKKGWTDSDWKEWWNHGYELAKQIKKLLPDYVDFYYMWKSKEIWKIRPETADDGGILAGNSPLPVEGC